MKVIFGLAMPDYKVTSVMWSEDGTIHERVLLTDGSVRDDLLNEPSLYQALLLRFSSHYPPHVADVTDIRTAFKYLGKMSDLVELLPEAHITPED